MSERGASMSDGTDFSGAYAGTAGILGATVRWLRDGKTLREWSAGIIAGGIFGYGCSAILQWKYPDIPVDVVIFASATTGIVSGILVEFVQRIATKIVSKTEAAIESRFESKLAPQQSKADGTATAAPGPDVLGSNDRTVHGVVISGPQPSGLFHPVGKQ